VVSSSYSRHAETAADRYSVELMQKTGGDPRALGAILSRIAADKDGGFELLRDHPDTKDRIAAINNVASNNRPLQLLSAPEWAALKTICAAVPDGGTPNGQAKSPDPPKPSVGLTPPPQAKP
jgi:beta-barrel assembly-enhancing protease